MWLQALALVGGLALLYWGAEWVVREASRLAHALGVSALLVGLTVVSLGTSAPEMVVGALASLRDQGELVVGNVIGSNVANIAVILGLTALLAPVSVELRLVRREIPLMIAISLAMLLLAVDREYSRADGGLLLGGLAAFLWTMARAARSAHAERRPGVQAYEAAFDAGVPASSSGPGLHSVALLLAGMGGLLLGAHLLVGSAVYFAETFGVSEVVVGILVVAVGTSLPELATSVVAAARRETGLAVGNIVGSNIFNVLAVLGLAAALRPVAVAPALLRFELPAMVLVSLLVLPLALAGRRYILGRWEGALLLGGYVAFTVVLLVRALAGPAA
jgi:cation:H+ antiporter